MTGWFTALSGREKALIGAAAVGLPALLIWQFAWVPVQNARQAQIDEIARLDTLIYIASQATSVTDAARETANPTPPSQRITQSAAQAGITVSRIEPTGDLLRVTVADLTFDEAIGWIADLDAEHGLVADQVDMARRAAPGTVSLTLALEPSR